MSWISELCVLSGIFELPIQFTRHVYRHARATPQNKQRIGKMRCKKVWVRDGVCLVYVVSNKRLISSKANIELVDKCFHTIFNSVYKQSTSMTVLKDSLFTLHLGFISTIVTNRKKGFVNRKKKIAKRKIKLVFTLQTIATQILQYFYLIKGLFVYQLYWRVSIKQHTVLILLFKSYFWV